MPGGKGIFVRGFRLVSTQHELKEFFQTFGEIEEIIFNKRQMYAIIEFQERASADFVLSQEIYLKGRKLKITRRKPQMISSKGVKAGTKRPIIKVSNTEKEDETASLSDILSVMNFDSTIRKFGKEMDAIGIKRKVDIICTSLHKALSPYFPGCSIFPFGSSVTGLASKESDADIYVDTGIWKSDESEYSPSNLVVKTRRILNQNYEFTKCISIPRARVPILKCFHKPTQLNCDINFQNALGVFNSHLIKFYISLDPHLREVIMFVKYWAKNNNLCGPGTFTSYAIVMLFIFYIQQIPNNSIPIVEVLQKNCKSQNVVQGWDCQFDEDLKNYPQSEVKQSFFEILGGFFNFYANFEFESAVVIMNYGVSVPRHVFTSITGNSVCFRYKLALQQRNADPIALDRVMCVLDPFQLNHNITASISLRVMNRFQIRCYKSAEIFQKIGNGETGCSLWTIVGLHPQQKKTKFPYLELWNNDCVKLSIPLKDFNPSNFFETEECDLNESSKTNVIEMLISQFKRIFERVLRFSLVREEVHELLVNYDREQVTQMEKMGDIQGHNGRKVFHDMTLFLSGCYYVWNGRGNAYKEFSFPADMNCIEKEMHVTNYLVDTFHQGSAQKPPKVDIKCIIVPIMGFRCLEVDIISCNQCEAFKPMIGFLLTILNKWLRQ